MHSQLTDSQKRVFHLNEVFDSQWDLGLASNDKSLFSFSDKHIGAVCIQQHWYQILTLHFQKNYCKSKQLGTLNEPYAMTYCFMYMADTPPMAFLKHRALMLGEVEEVGNTSWNRRCCVLSYIFVGFFFFSGKLTLNLRKKGDWEMQWAAPFQKQSFIFWRTWRAI